jgi:hypothetical protein
LPELRQSGRINPNTGAGSMGRAMAGTGAVPNGWQHVGVATTGMRPTGKLERNLQMGTTVRYKPGGEGLRLLNRALIGAGLLLAMLLVGVQLARAAGTVDYQFSTRPMTSGRVVSVNDHWLVVETDQGQKVGLVMDSHTMVPGEARSSRR